MVDPFTYSLKLSTKETIGVVEVYLPLVSEPLRSWIRGKPAELSKATYVPKPSVEAAKIGYDAELLKYLNSAPNVVLMRIPNQVCSQIKVCSSANRTVCHLSRLKKNKPDFPPCFDYLADDADVKSTMNLLISYLAENQYLFITDDVA